MFLPNILYLWVQMKKQRSIILLLMPFFVLSLYAQEDSLRVIRDSLQLIPKEPNEIQWVPFQLSADKRMDCPSPERISSYSSFHLSFKKPSFIIPYYTNPSPMFKGDYHTSGTLFAYRNGMLTGSETRQIFLVSDVVTMFPSYILIPSVPNGKFR